MSNQILTSCFCFGFFFVFLPQNHYQKSLPAGCFYKVFIDLFTIRLAFFLVSDWLFGGDISYLYGPARH